MITEKIVGKLPVFLGAYDSSKTYNTLNRVSYLGSEFQSKIDNNTYAPAMVNDTNTAITIDTEHWDIVSNGTAAYLAGDKLDMITLQDQQEFVKVVLDANGKVLCGVQSDGNFYFGKGVPSQVQEFIEEFVLKLNKVIDNNVAAINTSLQQTNNRISANEKNLGTKVDKVNGKGLIANDVADSLSNIDNPEYVKVETDNVGKLISGTKTNGEKLHNTKHIFLGGVEFNDTTKTAIRKDVVDNATSDLAKALKESGVYLSSMDWSDYISNDGDNPLRLPMPDCAIVNLITPTTLDLTAIQRTTAPKSQEGKLYNVPVEVQFWDMKGNYFKKKSWLSGQGNSSMGFCKKNIAEDLFDSEYGGDAFYVAFGDWVAQDSYQLKAYYTDFIKGSSIIAYRYCTMVERAERDEFTNCPWKRALLNSDKINLNYPLSKSDIKDMDLQVDTGALCHPDGFPVAVYQNGKFYGIFAWSLKKNRDNYHLDKNTAENVHLDGTIDNTTLLGGTIDWTAFEIRNPKGLYYKTAHKDKDGNDTFKYDADIATDEICGDDEVKAWETTGLLPDGTKITSKIKKAIEMTARVKNYIINLSKRHAEIAAITDSATKKTTIAKYIDIDTVIDTTIVNYITCDPDGYRKNWQWVTYDGIKWFVLFYDKDMSFGNHYTGMYLDEPWGVTDFTRGSNIYLFGDALTTYQSELITRAKALISDKVVSVDTVVGLLMDWVRSVGEANYKHEYNKWTDAPCNRDNIGLSSDWQFTRHFYYTTYNSSTTYSKDAMVASDGAMYKSLSNSNKGNAVTDTNYWQKVSFSSTTTYAASDVTYQIISGEICAEVKALKSTSATPLTKSGKYNPVYLGYKDNLWRYVKFITQQVNAFISYVNAQR